LEEGTNILLIAQRRTGKTSLMHEVSRQISDRFLCLHVDLEHVSSAADMVVELTVAASEHGKLWQKLFGVFTNLFNKFNEKIESIDIMDLKIKLRSGVDKGNWQSKGDQVFDILAKFEKPVVIFFDEVPILVNRILKDDNYSPSEGIHQVDLLMSWLRKKCSDHKKKVSMVITGSIGLGPVLKQVNLSATINKLKSFELKPWDRETVIGCLEALAINYGINFEDGVCQLMFNNLGCGIPHHVQVYFDSVYEYCQKAENMECSKKIANKVYKESMLSIKGHVELSHYEERIEMVLGKELFPFALDLLTEAAVTGHLSQSAIEILCNGHNRKNLGRVLEVLEHDGYLIKHKTKGYVFVSKLLKDWWKGRFGTNFIQASKRGIKL
jgi:hypothetical protein